MGRPRMTSRKWPDRPARAFHRRSVSSWVVLPMSAAKTGSSGRVRTTMSALIQSTTRSAPTARAGTTAPATSEGRKRAAYGSTVAAPCAARVTARSAGGRSSAGRVSQRRSRVSRRATETSMPAQAATRSAVQARAARTPNSAATTRTAAVRSSRWTTATTRWATANASAIVAAPWATPTAARTATGRRAAGAALSSRGSKGLIGGGSAVPAQWTETAAGMCLVLIRLRNTQYVHAV